ncbi:50S ribosomal protein L29 [Methanonatronarchaeum sp. AMET6-2]|uniref:50S ribosomal protein L29 n=1 Tax=Methanonatronarchaeum sp. AMET6-2 TaxID=2933293 RepID=UPI001222096A|nr:50S ribosomal protein L29 [Methanonatronarchaeum sp. AMET6-2]RZN60214.1 MAG: 50S ribosomal protein L29 [Methanonatronarchaeia archaeon]UOY10708.1 50S ribosomal protein L29 [Methanonatronarchaeum sp. AMET6-2]
MAILRSDEIREMAPEEREVELEMLENELVSLRAEIAAGGQPENPGRIREIRRTIARIKTVMREENEDNA